MTTQLLYLENMCQLECTAHVVEALIDTDGHKVVVDQTTFYPQGGGQPADKENMRISYAVS